MLMKGVQAIQGYQFSPSTLSFNSCLGGNLQTAFIVLKEKFRRIFYGEFQYDKRETFTF